MCTRAYEYLSKCAGTPAVSYNVQVGRSSGSSSSQNSIEASLRILCSNLQSRHLNLLHSYLVTLSCLQSVNMVCHVILLVVKR